MISRHVYEVIVVKSNDGSIINDVKMVATSSESALAKANLIKICEVASITPDDVEFVILKLGSLREVEEVKSRDVSSF